MTYEFLDSNDGASVADRPAEAIIELANLTGSNCLIVLKISARSTVQQGWFFDTPTWDGVNMNLAVARDAALAGNGSGKARIYYLVVGNLSNKTANAIVTCNDNSSEVTILATVAAYANMSQGGDVLHATNNFAFTSSASAITLSVTSNPTDLVVGVACFSSTSASSASPTSGQTKITGTSTTVSSNCAHVAAYDDAEGGGTTAGNWGSFTSAYTYVMASFEEGPPAPAGPVITSVNGGSTGVSNETNLAGIGTDLAPAGTTALYYADGSDFGTATLVGQAISSVTSTTWNWDAISLGAIGVGANFLFMVTDEGQAGELVSAAFPFTVTQAPPTITSVNGGSTAVSTQTNLAGIGTDLAPAGTTALYYADGSDFGTATLVGQSISSVTPTTWNWDAISLGAIGVGANFLFMVTDDGGGGELVSAAFAFTVTEPPAQAAHVRLGGCAPTANGVPPSIVAHSIINVGDFAEVYRTGTPATEFELRTHESSDASVSIVQNSDNLDFTVPTGSGAPEVFQVDSTSTRLSSTTTPTVWVTLAGDAKVLDGEEWKINMCLLVCNPPSDTSNSQMIWEVETSTGVFTEFDRYSSNSGLSISGNEQSMPIARTKNLVASMDAPRMRIIVHRIAAGSSVLWELPRWGGSRIAVTP